MSLTIASPGDIIKSSEVNANFNAGFKLQGEKAINDVSATNSGVLAGSSQVLIDKCDSDSTGINDTVDSTSTADFCNGYVCDRTISESTETIVDTANYETGPIKMGIKITTTSACYITYLQTYDTSDNATKWYITDSNFVILYSGDLINNAAYPNVSLANGTAYHILCDKSGADYLASRKSVTFPLAKTHFNIISGILQFGAVDTNYAHAFQTIKTSTSLTYNDSYVLLKLPKNKTKSIDLTSTLITNGNFETGSGSSPTGWTYSETDPSGVISGAINTSSPISGTQDYKFTYYRASGGEVNYNGSITQTVDCNKINSVICTFKKSASTGTGMQSAWISLSVGFSEWSYNLTTSAETNTVMNVDTSNLSGNQTLQIKIGSRSSGGTSGALAYTVQVDTVMCYGDDRLNIPSGMTNVFVTPLLSEALETGDSITADVSIDGGATFTTGLAVNTWSTITSTTGTDLQVKINLDTNDGTTTPKVKGWRCLLE